MRTDLYGSLEKLNWRTLCGLCEELKKVEAREQLAGCGGAFESKRAKSHHQPHVAQRVVSVCHIRLSASCTTLNYHLPVMCSYAQYDSLLLEESWDCALARLNQ